MDEALLMHWLVTHDTAYVGSRTFHRIAHAFEAADGGEGAPYDILKNNCASIILGMLYHLDLEVTEGIKEYAVTEILAIHDLVDTVFASPHLKDFFAGDASKADARAVIKAAVDMYVDQHYVHGSLIA